MQITEPAKEKIQSILSPYPHNTYFNISVIGDSLQGFNWNFCIDTSRISAMNKIPDAEVYMCVDPFITTDYNSYPALFDKMLDFDRATDEFIITPQMQLG